MALTFESGLDSLMHFVGLKGEEAFHANAADPLHAAFRAKVAVHAGPMGMPMIWALARGKLTIQSQARRKGACLHSCAVLCDTLPLLHVLPERLHR